MKLDDDDFTLLGLPQRHAIDRAALDSAWRRLQGEVHPDRFAAQGAAAQRLAMQWAVRVNEAYQRLKEPLPRAAYLCELRGAAVDAERNTAMPAAFLMQQMAWREALEDAAGLAAVEALDAEVAAAERALLADVARRLDDEGDAVAAAADVRALMFVNRFRQDIERRLDTLDPTR
ncbi:Fe-S protein assembly co-chaperone HscB [Rubrivivax gelatinosus]|nr:Fe-S protein assembly co-chaperone HscB [Rubrivivax gelatinosus]